MKDAGRKGGFGLGFCKHFIKVFFTSGTAGSDDRNGNHRGNGIDQFDVKTHVGAVAVNAVEQYFPGAQFFTDLGQGNGIQVPPLPAAFDCALLPAIRLTAGTRLIRFNNGMLDLCGCLYINPAGVN